MHYTDISTYFTVPDGISHELFPGVANQWIRLILTLETAGPVAVSTRQDVTPVLSGKGILLDPGGEPSVFELPPGDRLFIAAEAVNRVKFIVQPIPYLQQILLRLEYGFDNLKGLKGAAGALLRRLGGNR